MARRSSSLAVVLLLQALAALAWVALTWCGSSDLSMPPSNFVSGLTAARRAGAARSPAVAMQSEKIDKIVDSLKELTLLEASELVTAIEETFGVDASASAGAVMMAAPAAAEEKEAKVEKTEFDLVLTEVPKEKKIAILKV